MSASDDQLSAAPSRISCIHNKARADCEFRCAAAGMQHGMDDQDQAVAVTIPLGAVCFARKSICSTIGGGVRLVRDRII